MTHLLEAVRLVNHVSRVAVWWHFKYIKNIGLLIIPQLLVITYAMFSFIFTNPFDCLGGEIFPQIIHINIPLWLVTCFTFYIWEFHLLLELQLKVNFEKKSSFFFLSSSTRTTFIVPILGLPVPCKSKYIKQVLWIYATGNHKNKTKWTYVFLLRLCIL